MRNHSDPYPLPNPNAPEIAWEKLDRMDWQLWALAILLIVVLGAGLLAFMFPAAFWSGEDFPVSISQRAFFGFCVLLTLTLLYLLEKNAKVRQLKRELIEAQKALAAAEREAAIQSFQTLPSLNQFRDALAMEYRRASASGTHVAVALFTVYSASPEGLGRVSRLLHTMLRHGETLYRISDKAIGVILPAMNLGQGASFAARVEALSQFPIHEMEVSLTAYPDDAGSLKELEGRLRGTEPIAFPVLQRAAGRA